MDISDAKSKYLERVEAHRLLLIDLLDEVYWFMEHSRSRIMPISYIPKLKEAVKLAREDKREELKEMLKSLKETRKESEF